jgi:hypothetical protein
VTETLIPPPPTSEYEGGGEEEAFVVFVWGTYAPEEGVPAESPVLLSIDWGEGNTLIMFSDRNLAEQFVASPTFVEVKTKGVIKGSPAEQFIKMLGIGVESDWIEKVLVNPNPLDEWLEGNCEGAVVDAAELHEDLAEAYRDFLDD